jgi:hypothetical protein
VRFNPDGTKDRTFGKRGVFAMSPRLGFSEGHAVAVAPDGTGDVLVGVQFGGPSEHSSLIRLTSRGKPDRTFAARGTSTAFGGPVPRITDLILQDEDKYVVLGTESGIPKNQRLARYLVA